MLSAGYWILTAGERIGGRQMANRSGDWLRQAEADLRHARNAANSHDYDWSCFAGHQAAEKALKAVFLSLGMDAWGHTLTALIGNLPESARCPDELVECCRMLDKHYILTRYPNGFDSGAPADFYTQQEAQIAISQAEAVLEFCRRQVSGSRRD